LISGLLYKSSLRALVQELEKLGRPFIFLQHFLDSKLQVANPELETNGKKLNYKVL
jgi:hypothetical protein